MKTKKDCKFYRNENTHDGCFILKKLYCKIENKPCAFYKAREEKRKVDLEKKGGEQ